MPMGCGQCHDAAFQVTLQGSLASANGAQPAFNGGAQTCSNVYCHSGGPGLLLGGGTLPVPVWNPPSVGSCGACHASPGGPVDTSAWHPAVATGVQCALCHPGFTNASVNRNVHVNAVVDLTRPDMMTNCAACHGDVSRVVPPGTPANVKAAPPVDRNGSSSTAQRGVGAHQRHLLPGVDAIAGPVACGECHVVPSDLAHVGPFASTPATVTWGALASANGATPALVPPPPGSTSFTCSNVYCHGGGPGLPLGGGTLTSPTWNPPSVVTCGACHALPGGTTDTSAWHPAIAAGSGCGLCHAGYTRVSVNPLVHVNGIVDVSPPGLSTSCAACHGDPNRVLPPGTSADVMAAPPVDRTGSSDTRRVGVGAHQAHLLPGASAISEPMACTECHVVPTNLVHVGPGPTTPATLDWGPLATAKVPRPRSTRHRSPAPTTATARRWRPAERSSGPSGPGSTGPRRRAGPATPRLPRITSHPSRVTGGMELPLQPLPPAGLRDRRRRSCGRSLPRERRRGHERRHPAGLVPHRPGPNGWTGTSTVGCHGGTRYWNSGFPNTGCF